MSKCNVLITGGARGIGAATAKALAQDGYRVFINYVNSTEIAENLASKINNNGGEALTFRADVRNDQQLEAMFNTINVEFGGVDILVSNANMHFSAGPFLDMSWDEFSQKINDEMHAAFACSKLAAQQMKQKGSGRIIFISSTLSQSPASGFIAHGTAKGALDSFNKYLAQELGPYGITSNIVAPGLIQTDSTRDAPEEFKEIIRMNTPTQRLGTPEDVASAVRFLAGEHSGHITGVYMPVCGGAYLS